MINKMKYADKPGRYCMLTRAIHQGMDMPDETCQISCCADISTIPLDLLLLADPSEDMINQYLHSSTGIVCEMDGAIIGALLMAQTQPHIMEIMNVAVYGEHQHRGFGKALIMEAVKTAREMGAARLEIGTGNSSVSQLLLYQKCGFRIVGVVPDFFRKNYPEKIFENGVECRDQIRLEMLL